MNKVDEQPMSFTPMRVGEQLRQAREAQGRELDEIATITRIPLRHLRLIEAGEHAELPATPYSVGFVRTYAQAIGLDAPKLAQEFRAELGAAPIPQYVPEPFEPADPKRVPSRALALVALLIAVLLAGGYAIWRSGTLTGDDATARAKLAAGTDAAPPPPVSAAAPRPAAPPPVAAGGPVVVTATDGVWLRIYEGNGGPRYLERVMKAGETFQVPATAKDPQILTGRPQAIRVTVGNTVIPPLGTPERTIADVSLRPEALLARSAAPSPAASPPAALSPAAAGSPPAVSPPAP